MNSLLPATGYHIIHLFSNHLIVLNFYCKRDTTNVNTVSKWMAMGSILTEVSGSLRRKRERDRDLMGHLLAQYGVYDIACTSKNILSVWTQFYGQVAVQLQFLTQKSLEPKVPRIKHFFHVS